MTLIGAIDQCSLALEIDPKAVKALYLRGQAHYGARQYDQALADVKAEKKINFQNEQQTMQKMFAKGLYDIVVKWYHTSRFGQVFLEAIMANQDEVGDETDDPAVD